MWAEPHSTLARGIMSACDEAGHSLGFQARGRIRMPPQRKYLPRDERFRRAGTTLKSLTQSHHMYRNTLALCTRGPSQTASPPSMLNVERALPKCTSKGKSSRRTRPNVDCLAACFTSFD